MGKDQGATRMRSGSLGRGVGLAPAARGNRRLRGGRFKILVVHGPNLHLLGTRNPSVYGRVTLSQINQRLKEEARCLHAQVTVMQSNHEGQIVEAIGKALGRYHGILINPAAYTHTSVAIRDALEASGLPAVEVHLSNIYARESFRHRSLMAPVAIGQISGFGALSYTLGLDALVGWLTSPSNER